MRLRGQIRRACAVVLFAWAAAALTAGCAFRSRRSSAATSTPITGSNLSGVDLGRAVYTGRCGDCHSLPSINSYSAGEWPGIVSSMSRKANLTSSEQQAVLDYIRSVQANSGS